VTSIWSFILQLQQGTNLKASCNWKTKTLHSWAKYHLSCTTN